MERVFAAILVFLLLGLGVFFLFRQFRNAQWLKSQPQLSPEDRAYYRWLIIRRVLGSFLMLVIAGMLIWIYTSGMAEGWEKLMKEGEIARQTGQQMNDQQREFMYSSMKYMGVIMILVFVLLTMMFWDLVATRKFGMRHRQRIREDRRAMLERQLPILMAERRMKKEIFDTRPPRDNDER